ncbi:MAG: HD domain-containing protein [Crocinitomicaceae bacterium]|nr:HD domain-containing protein [Crocinitomicaceae bacterium]MBT5402800.1 HD domain-containing protein [Crocinitomicaceae bacterium]MBT6029906.1 HD domain-containing protein [Crocinitomicaceae bacterium]MBT6513361.1 HD domain-containing protein [Crocinitomicaceae bacterium]
MVNKKKIFNDPIYGFISIPHELILDLIDHRYFQRLRRIKQLGLTDFVYPGALHTRFHHALGCTFLMQQAIASLRQKGHEITETENIGAIIAILLHDIGHGPFSHALEHTVVQGITHEEISLLFMQQLNQEFEGQLDTAIAIFNDSYPKKFLHQLVSSQLDIDRLDYLKRDSFYSGVSEGIVSSERIIDMLDVVNDNLVIQQKGIYSVEKFIVARRLMYWQVYLHKTVISAEFMLVKILERAKLLTGQGENLFCSEVLKFFLYNQIDKNDFQEQSALDQFAKLDDYDLMGAIKVWSEHSDKLLRFLCKAIVNRTLFKVIISKEPFDDEIENKIVQQVMDTYGMNRAEAASIIINEEVANNAYNSAYDSINVLFKNGEVKDIADASDNLNIQTLASPVRKYFMCHPLLSS